MPGSNSRPNVSEGYEVPLSYRGDRSVCFLPIYSGHQVRWTYQPGSHKRKVTQDFSCTFLLRCVPKFFSREGFSSSFPSSAVKSNFVCVCVCVFSVFSSHSFWTSMDVPAGVTQEESHTGFLIHLLSAVHALIFLSRRIQPIPFPRRP